MPAQPPVDLATLLSVAGLNPVVIAVAAWLGWQADQWQKVPVAAFAAAVAGSAVLWLAMTAGFFASLARGMAGLFAAQFIAGVLWAGIAFLARSRRRT